MLTVVITLVSYNVEYLRYYIMCVCVPYLRWEVEPAPEPRRGDHILQPRSQVGLLRRPMMTKAGAYFGFLNMWQETHV